jgi:hypothetical protein
MSSLAERWCRRDKDELFKKYPKVRDCERDGSLTIDTKPDIYHTCPDSSEAKALGEDIEISQNISESE